MRVTLSRHLGFTGVLVGLGPVVIALILSATWSMARKAAVGANVVPVSFTTVGLTFLKIGLVFFGGGSVLIPVLHQQLLVDQLHWLMPQEFLDGVDISNHTPGPISVLATFAGYHLLGVYGAVPATLALLSPSMILMKAICIAYERLKSSSHAQDFLAAVAPTVVGLVASAALLLWRSAIPSWLEVPR